MPAFKSMNGVLVSLISTLLISFRSRLVLQAEILALRHQLNVLRRSTHARRRLRTSDRILWVWLSHLWPDWRSALLIIKPETVIRWHRRRDSESWRASSSLRAARSLIAPPIFPLDRLPTRERNADFSLHLQSIIPYSNPVRRVSANPGTASVAQPSHGWTKFKSDGFFGRDRGLDALKSKLIPDSRRLTAR